MIFSKDSYIKIIYLLIYTIPLIFIIINCLKLAKITDSSLRKKNQMQSLMALIFMGGSAFLLFNILNVDSLLDKLPFKFTKLEDAYKFDYNNPEEIAFKKKYKNTYFVVGREKNGIARFDSYKETTNGWKNLVGRSHKYLYELHPLSYDVYYFNNTSENITGIFILNFSEDEESNITDKYKTEFKVLTDKNGKEINYLSYSKKLHRIYFGLVKHNIGDNYYIVANEEKIKFSDYKNNGGIIGALKSFGFFE